MLAWITVAIIVLLLAWFLSRGSGYRAIFDERHLAQFASQVQSAKAAACAQPGQPQASLSSAGISFAYTVTRTEAGDFRHHYSISRPNEILPHAVGEPFTLYIARLIGVPIEHLNVEPKPPQFFHAGFVLSPGQHQAFAGQGIQKQLTPEEARQLFGECQAARRQGS